jgi:hypothetical protein
VRVTKLTSKVVVKRWLLQAVMAEGLPLNLVWDARRHMVAEYSRVIAASRLPPVSRNRKPLFMMISTLLCIVLFCCSALGTGCQAARHVWVP